MRDGRLRCELLNRHDTHTQTLMPMSGDALVVVAPAAVDFSEPAHFDTVRAFALPQLHVCASAPRHVALGPVSRRRAERPRSSTSRAAATPNDNGVVHFVRDHDLAYEVKTKLD